MNNILITGAQGQLGSELTTLLKDRAIAASRADLDITNKDQVFDYCLKNKPEAIVNCAAYTAVDKAEEEKTQAFAVNEKGAANLAMALNIPFIHISTDFVYDGQKPGLYKEEHPVNPIGVYGKSKLAGEQAVLKANPQSMIIRTSWVYSSYGKNFVKTILRVAREKGHLRVVADQTVSPTYAFDLAQAIVKILPSVHKGYGQIFNYSNSGTISWFDFAKAIVEIGGVPCSIEPIETHEYPTPAARPANSALNTSKIRECFGLEIPYWRDSLYKCIKQIAMAD